METKSEKKEGPVSPGNRWLRRGLLALGPLALLAGGAVMYVRGGRFVSSDNAYVHSRILTVSAEVSGRVVEVAVHDNEPVAAGQVLFRLDDEPFRTAVASARAGLDAARIELASLRGSYRAKLAAIDEAREQVSFAESGLAREKSLSTTGVSTAVALDQANHEVSAARRHLATLEQDAATVLASLGGRIDCPDEQFPHFAVAKAELERAERDLRRTVATAPFAGIATNVAGLPVGTLFQVGFPGQPGITLVAAGQDWIEANLKETQLGNIKAGDPVAIKVDAYPDQTWQGHVAGIGPATGAEFSLIPAQNASGNWIKTVQRVAVRVTVDNPDPSHPLRAGLSTEVEIDTGRSRTWRDLAPFLAKHSPDTRSE